MNFTMTLIQNANSLNIDISRLITYMSIVLDNTDMEPNEVIKGFSQLFDRMMKIWTNDDSGDWNSLKSILNEHKILVDEDGNVKPFCTIISNLLCTYNLYSTFEKSELLTALAEVEYRNILLALFENRNKDCDANAVNMIATAMLENIHINQNGGTKNG